MSILCPELPVTYPESANVAVVKLLPPSLLILAIISVFRVGVSTFSWNTTILLLVGTEVAVNAFDTIVVDDLSNPVPVSKTKPSSPVPESLCDGPGNDGFEVYAASITEPNTPSFVLA